MQTRAQKRAAEEAEAKLQNPPPAKKAKKANVAAKTMMTPHRAGIQRMGAGPKVGIVARREPPELSVMLGPFTCVECNDPVDPISLETVWTEGADGTRQPGEIEHLFTWQEGKFARGMNIVSVRRMLRHAPQDKRLTHPTSGVEIDDGTLHRMRRTVTLMEGTGELEKWDAPSDWTASQLTEANIRHYATTVCSMILTVTSMHVAEEAFLLPSNTVRVFVSEIQSILPANAPGILAFMNPPSFLSPSLVMQHYLLRETERLIDATPADRKALVVYIIIGALSIVCPEVRAQHAGHIALGFVV